MTIEMLYTIPGTDINVVVEVEHDHDKGDRWTPPTDYFDILSIKREDGRNVSDEAIVRLIAKMFPDRPKMHTVAWLDEDIEEKAQEYYSWEENSPYSF